jgi:hypothetical protein
MLLPPRRAKSIEAAEEENDQGAINDSIIDLLISSSFPVPQTSSFASQISDLLFQKLTSMLRASATGAY